MLKGVIIMNINKDLLKAIEDSMNHKGLSIELISDIDKNFFILSEEIEDDNIRTYINAGTLDSHMFLYTFAKMLKIKYYCGLSLDLNQEKECESQGIIELN